MRVNEPAQSPEPNMAQQLSDVNREKVLDHQTIRSRNSRSAGKGIPYDARIHDCKECPFDLPNLVETDDEGQEKQSPTIWPSPINHPEHYKFYWYDSQITVHTDDILHLFGDELYFRREDRLHVLNTSKRGPHRPSQALLEEHAMRTQVSRHSRGQWTQ